MTKSNARYNRDNAKIVKNQMSITHGILSEENGLNKWQNSEQSVFTTLEIYFVVIDCYNFGCAKKNNIRKNNRMNAIKITVLT